MSLADADLLCQWLGDLVGAAVAAESGFVVDHGDGYCCRSTGIACKEPCRPHVNWQLLCSRVRALNR